MNRKELIKTSTIIAIITIFAKLIGFLRGIIVAYFYGETWEMDAFFFAENLPGMIFPSICMSLSTAFLPLYVKKKASGDNAVGFANSSFKSAVFIAIVMGLFGMLISRWIVPVLAPGFEGEQLGLTVTLSQITMITFVLLMLQYMLSAILNANKVFYFTQVAGIINNLLVIGITMILSANKSIFVLMLAVIIGQMGQVILVGIPASRFLPGLFSAKIDKGYNKILFKMALPIVIGNGVLAINSAIDRLLATKFSEGSVSALSYSETVTQLITGVFITSMTTVLYPAMTEEFSKNNMQGFIQKINDSRNLLFFIIMPIGLFLALGAENIVQLLYERGSFDHEATVRTAGLLSLYALGYGFLAVREVYSRAYFAQGDSKTPTCNSIVGIAVNCICSIVLAHFIGLKGIALGTSMANVLIALLMMVSFRRKLSGDRLDKEKNLLKILIATVITGIAVYLSKGAFYVGNIIIELIICFLEIAILYCILCYFLKCSFMIDVYRLCLLRIKGTK